MSSILDRKPRKWTESEWFDFNMRWEVYAALAESGELAQIDGKIALENLERYFQWIRHGTLPATAALSRPKRVA